MAGEASSVLQKTTLPRIVVSLVAYVPLCLVLQVLRKTGSALAVLGAGCCGRLQEVSQWGA